MPELPEVYTITQDLKRYCTNAKIMDAVSKGPGYGIHANINALKGRTITNVERVSKYMFLDLDEKPETQDKESILIHLGMTGSLLLRTQGHAPDAWTRVILTLEKNNKIFELRFTDKRMFGKMDLINSSQNREIREKHGPEVINNSLSPAEFLKRMQSKKTNIKNVLMDQSIVAGLGNAYANDALWIAGIHPETPTKNLTAPQAETLLNACREILNEGIKNRGISMSDYVDLFGKKGRQQEFFRVYQQEKCKRCGGKVEFYKLNGRGTYFCPTCQRLSTP